MTLTSRELVESMTDAQVENLVSRVRLVESWVAEFSRAVGMRRRPRVRIAHSCAHYAPLSNKLGIPAYHLVNMPDNQLRLVVAHEYGHFLRRWPSLFAWTFFARMKEEARADRAALRLTDADIDAWEVAVRSVAQIEHADDLESAEAELSLRRRMLEARPR